MNNATFAGRLGRDAELRHTQNGDPVVSFSLAVDEYAGKNERRTLWVDCSMWGKRAESLVQYLAKGAPVTASGQVGVRAYESRGETRPVLTLRVSELTLMGGKSDGQTPRHSSANDRPQSRDTPTHRRDISGDTGTGPVEHADDFQSDDIPFITARGIW